MSSSKRIDLNDQEETFLNSKDTEAGRLNLHIVVVDEKQAETRNYREILKELKEIGKLSRTDQNQPTLSEKPSWFNEDLFKHVKSVYERHFMGINFAHLSGLLLLVRVNSIYKTLNATNKSSTVAQLFRRYYHTVRHVKTWYEGDIFDDNSDAYRSLLMVRGMHNKVSNKFNDAKLEGLSDESCEQSEPIIEESAELVKKIKSAKENNDKHISEFDVMITQFAFVGFIVTDPKKVGLIEDFSARDLESLLHFWRVIGYYLGVSEKFNLCSYELKDIIGLCEAIRELEYKQSMKKNKLDDPPGIMSVNIVRSVKFIPMLTIYGIMRHLYEILDFEISEIEGKQNWYSNLSYTLIKLVMTQLLAYKPFRSFNNGLTRLSLYLVNNIEGWFSDHLDSKYGQKLKAWNPI